MYRYINILHIRNSILCQLYYVHVLGTKPQICILVDLLGTYIVPLVRPKGTLYKQSAGHLWKQSICQGHALLPAGALRLTALEFLQH